MSMVYFQNPDDHQVYAYDAADPNDAPYIQAATDAGWTSLSGPPAPPPLSLPDQARVAMGQGLTCNITGSLTLSATFPVDGATTTKINAVITTVATTGGFAGGVSTFPMKDTSSGWHEFTLGQYTAVAAAIANYVTTLSLIIDGYPGAASSLPSATVSVTAP